MMEVSREKFNFFKKAPKPPSLLKSSLLSLAERNLSLLRSFVMAPALLYIFLKMLPEFAVMTDILDSVPKESYVISAMMLYSLDRLVSVVWWGGYEGSDQTRKLQLWYPMQMIMDIMILKVLLVPIWAILWPMIK